MKSGEENGRIRRAVDAAHAAALNRIEGQVFDGPTHANLKALRAELAAETNSAKAKAKAKATATACAEAAGVRTSIFV